MNRKIIQIAPVWDVTSEEPLLYALYSDGTVWFINPEPDGNFEDKGWHRVEEIDQNMTDEDKANRKAKDW